ncbi:S-phase kinase-associated protein 2-like [Saccoglossus kowalevskii]
MDILTQPVHLTWDVDESSKMTIYSDMGVGELLSATDENHNENENEENTDGPNGSQFVTPSESIVPASSVLRNSPLKPQCSNNTRHHNEVNNYKYSGVVTPKVAEHLQATCLRLWPASTPGTDYFSHMSDEIVLNVFKWLPLTTMAKCARVCRRWSSLAFDESLWRRPFLTGKTFKDGQIGKIFLRGMTAGKFTKSDIIGPAYDSKDLADLKKEEDVIILRRKSKKCVRVQYIDMSQCHVNPNSLADLLQPCHQLRKLCLECCEVNDRVLHSLTRTPDLEVLNLCMCAGITAQGITKFLNSCQNLKSLNISWTSLDRVTLVAVVNHLPNTLQKLNIGGFRHLLTDDEVIMIGVRCPNLVELDLSDSALLSSVSIHFLMDRLCNLQFLALSRCYNIPISTLVQLGAMQCLVALNIFGLLQDAGLQNIKASMPRVEINRYPFSSIARPTTGHRRKSIWGIRCYE